MLENALWTIAELLTATGGRLLGKVSRPLNGVVIDSRVVAPGDIFVAIKGDKLDGHEFAVSALSSGAGLAIVSVVTEEMLAAGPLLVVPHDPLLAMENIGRAARHRCSARIIAITGSVGKTSTKEMLRVALSATGATHASVASFNNHWGVPLTLARLQKHDAFAVFEIGMNHAGEITPLVAMVGPQIAIITSIAPSHLGQFDSLDGIAAAKAEIFSGVEKGGHAIVPRDSEYFGFLQNAARTAGINSIVSFGRHERSDVRLERVALHQSCCCITADVLGERVTYKLGTPGEHMAVNSLAVLAAVKLSGADLARGALALAEAKPAKGRGVQQSLKAPGGEILLIDESYNANPTSVKAALSLLAHVKPVKGGRRIAVLGDMLELGKFGPEMHAAIEKDIAAFGIDKLYAAGPLMSHLWRATPTSRRGAYAETSADLKDEVLNAIHAGDCVMIKGSNGSRMGLIGEAMRVKWPVIEKEI